MKTLMLREAVHLVRITHLVSSTPGVGTHVLFFFLPTLYNPLQCSQPTSEGLDMVRGCGYSGMGPL